MKFTGLLPFAVTALAAVTRRQNEADQIAPALQDITAATNELNTQVLAFTTDITDVQTATNAVLAAISAANAIVVQVPDDSIGGLTAIGLLQPTQDLNAAVSTAIDSTIAQKDAFVAAGFGPTVLQSLLAQQAASVELTANIIQKIDPALKDAAAQNAQPAADDLARGIAAFQDQAEQPATTTTAAPDATTTADESEPTEDPTEAPIYPTEAPIYPTEAPVYPTEAPIYPTEAPIYPTEAPIYPSEDAPTYPSEDAPIYPSEDAPIYPSEDAPSYGSEAAPSYGSGEAHPTAVVYESHPAYPAATYPAETYPAGAAETHPAAAPPTYESAPAAPAYTQPASPASPEAPASAPSSYTPASPNTPEVYTGSATVVKGSFGAFAVAMIAVAAF